MDDLFLRLSLKCRSWYCTFSWNLLFSPLDFILSLLPLSLLKYFSPLLFSLQSLSFEEQCFCSSWVSLPYFLSKYQSPLVSSYLTSFLCLALKILKENDNINCQSLVQSPVQVEGLGLSLWSLLPTTTTTANFSKINRIVSDQSKDFILYYNPYYPPPPPPQTFVQKINRIVSDRIKRFHLIL